MATLSSLTTAGKKNTSTIIPPPTFICWGADPTKRPQFVVEDASLRPSSLRFPGATYLILPALTPCGQDLLTPLSPRYWNKTRCWCGKLTSEIPRASPTASAPTGTSNPTPAMMLLLASPPRSPSTSPRVARAAATAQRLPITRRHPLVMISIGPPTGPMDTLPTKFGNIRMGVFSVY